MKKFLKQILLLLITIAGTLYQSQSVIIDLNDSQLGQPEHYYSKDLNNLLDQFEGTYLYSSSSMTLKVILKKKIMQYNGSYYEDLIIGEYQYIENGVEKINTLSNLDIVYNNQFAKHSITGTSTFGNNTRSWKCPQCQPNEQRLFGKITDNNERSADFFVRKILVNGQHAILIKISGVRPSFETMTPPPFSLPLGEMTLIKQ